VTGGDGMAACQPPDQAAGKPPSRRPQTPSDPNLM